MFSKSDLFKIILPVIAQQILATTASTVNSIMVAGAGEAAVSGVALVGTLDALLIVMLSSLVSGGAVVLSHAHKNENFARECTKQLIYMTTLIALFITIVLSILGMPLISLLYGSAGAPGFIADASVHSKWGVKFQIPFGKFVPSRTSRIATAPLKTL